MQQVVHPTRLFSIGEGASDRGSQAEATSQKAREGCGCPERLFRQLSTLQKMLPRFSGSTKNAAIPAKFWALSSKGKWLLENWRRLRKRSWFLSSDTATAFSIAFFLEAIYVCDLSWLSEVQQ